MEHIDIPFNKLIELPTDSMISTDGLIEIKQLMYDSTELNDSTVDLILFNAGANLMTSRGKFAKRIKAQASKRSTKLPDTLISEIGNIAQNNTLPDMTWYIDFTNDFDWTDGDFGDYDSCYWTCNSEARDRLYDTHGFALRTFEKNSHNMEMWHKKDNISYAGKGRCWIMWDTKKKIYVLFNGYGESDRYRYGSMQTRHFATLFTNYIKTVSDETINKTKVNFRPSNSILFVNNGGRAYLIGTDKQTEQHHDTEIFIQLNYDTSIYETNRYDYHCDDCGTGLREDDVHHSPDDHYLCDECFAEHYRYCDDCGEPTAHEEITAVRGTRGWGNIICKYCLDRAGYKQCADCDEYTEVEKAQSEKDYCQLCINENDYLKHCSKCGDLTDDDSIKTMPHDNCIKLCENCIEDFDFDDDIKELMKVKMKLGTYNKQIDMLYENPVDKTRYLVTNDGLYITIYQEDARVFLEEWFVVQDTSTTSTHTS